MYCAVLFSALKIMKKIDGPVKYGMVLEGITLVNTYQNIYVVKTKYCYKLWNDRVLQGLKMLYVLIVYDSQWIPLFIEIMMKENCTRKGKLVFHLKECKPLSSF